MLASRQPSLLNAPGIRAFDGVPVPLTPNLVYFDEDLPRRDRIPVLVELMDDTTRVIQSPVTTSVEGAVAIQEMFDRYEWVSQAGSPVAYAPLIRKAPPSSGTTKMPLYVMLKGDQSVQNPTTTAILRAGELADRTMYYRHDLARADSPSLPANPHGFRIDTIAPTYRELSAIYFATDGAQVIRPDPMRYFEFPIPLPPEGLNYMR
jgi:hypothetical protein